MLWRLGCKCWQHVGNMSATRQNVANFPPDRAILATWFTVCWHTFVSLFPDIDIPRTDNICAKVSLSLATPPLRCRCLHCRRAAVAATAALLPSCRHHRQAGCRLQGAVTALPPPLSLSFPSSSSSLLSSSLSSLPFSGF